MRGPGSESDLVAALAAEFLERQRRGEQPRLEEYLIRHPDLAVQIRERFPELIPGWQADSGDLTSAVGMPARQGRLHRLGDYRIVREIGRGGMGVVYEAVQESLGRRVALKVLPGHGLLDSQLAIRFRREAQAVARLHHTNIVQVYGVGEHQGLDYYVMQYIEGRSLDHVLAELRALHAVAHGTNGQVDRKEAIHRAAEALAHGRSASDLLGFDVHEAQDVPTRVYVPSDAPDASKPAGRDVAVRPTGFGPRYWRAVARIGVQVAEALAHAHGQGILHRDIKPSNLLLDAHGTVWVTDFGLAKDTGDADALTRTGDLVGTLRYLAPERFRGRSDARGDIYSLGLTLYELLTLTPAFRSQDRSQLLEEVMHAEPPRPRQVDRTVPRDLETIVLKAINRDADRRYVTARALAEDLGRFLEDRPIRARRATLPERFWRVCRRNPGIASLGLAVFVLCVTVAVGSTVAALRIARARDNEEHHRLLAEEHARQVHQVLVQLQVTRGLQLMDEGDLFSSLAWFTRALELDRGEPAEEMHRIRLKAALRQSPRLTQMWFHGGPTFWVEVSPDGRHAVTAGDDHVARVWDLVSGVPVTPPLIHGGSLPCARYSPDGRRILTCSRDGTARVWDAGTGLPVTGLMRHERPIWHAAFSPDGRLVGTASDDRTGRVWDAATGLPVTPPLRHEATVWQVAFGPGGHRVLTTGEDMTVKVWDTATGQLVIPVLKHPAATDWAEFSPDGRRVLTAAGDTVYLWDAATGQPVFAPRQLPGFARHGAISPDGGRAVLAGGDMAQIWDLATGLMQPIRIQHPVPIWFIAFDPQGRRVVTVGGNAARVWDAGTGRALTPLLKHNGLANHASFSPDGRFLATTGGETANVWDTAIVPPEQKTLENCRSVASAGFSPDGRHVAAFGDSSGQLKIWDTATGRLLSSPQLFPGAFRSACFSPDGGWLATTHSDRTAGVWELSTGKRLVLLPQHAALVRSAAVSSDRRFVITACEDRTARVWEVASGLPKGPILHNSDMVARAVFHPDGRRVLVTCVDWTVQVWDWTSGERIGKPLKHGGPVWQAEFSPDGERILTASHDRTARIWDAATGRPLTPPLQHGGIVHGATFSPDGRYMATACSDGTLRVWETVTLFPVTLPLRHSAEAKAVVFSQDGHHIQTVSADGKVWRWDLGLTPDSRPPEDFQGLAELLCGYQLDASGGFMPVSALTLRDLWQRLRNRYPQDFIPVSDGSEHK